MPSKSNYLYILLMTVSYSLLMSGCQIAPINSTNDSDNDARHSVEVNALPFKIYSEPHYHNNSLSTDGLYLAQEDRTSSRVSYASRQSLSHAQDRHARKKNKDSCVLSDKHSSYILSKSGWMELIIKRNEVVIKNKEDGDELSRLSGHCLELKQLVFSPDNKILATGGRDSVVFLWDWKKGERLGKFGSTLHINPRLYVNKLLFSADSRQLATLFSNNDVIIMNPLTGKLIVNIQHYKHLRGRLSKQESIERKLNKITTITYSSGDNYLLLAQKDRIAIHDAKSGKFVRYITHPTMKSINDMAIDIHNKILFVSTNSQNNISAWNTRDWTFIKTIYEPGITSHLALSKDSKYLVTTGSNAILSVYNLPDMKKYKTIQFGKNGTPATVLELKFDHQNNLRLKARGSHQKKENGELIPVVVY